MRTVSVVIPAYNSEKYIAEAINSVLNQKGIDFEIIVVDDGSTDKTKEIVCLYGDKIQYLYQRNAGSGKARNAGIKKSSSSLIAFLDSDDYWDEEHLKTMLKVLNDSPEACLAYCGKKWVDDKGHPLEDVPEQKSFPGGWIFKEMFGGNYISSSSVVIARKDALLEVGGFSEAQELRNAQDYHLWLRMCAKYPVASSSQKTVKYRRHGTNRTADHVSRLRGVLYALESAVALLDEGGVDDRNDFVRINVKKRMREYLRSVIYSLYSEGNYSSVEEFSWLAIREGYWSVPMLSRLFLAIMPAQLRVALHYMKK